MICLTVIVYSEVECVCLSVCVCVCVCVVTEAVQRNHATAKASWPKIEHQIKEWLKFAAERDGGRRQRDRRSRASAPLPAPADTQTDSEHDMSE